MANQSLRAFRGRVIHRGLVAVSFLVRLLPLPVARGIGLTLGHMGWHVLRRDRRRALDNIALAFPDWPASRRNKTIRAMFHHLGVSLTEILWLPNVTTEVRDKTTVVEGLEPVLEMARSGRGVIAFTGHCGNWEWIAQTVASFGVPVSVLQRERNEAELNKLITEIRAQAGIRTIDRGATGAGRELIQAIRRGGILAFLIDQNIRTESVKVPFFGRPALTPLGPAKLAVRTEAMVVSGFIERRNGKQIVRFGPLFEVKRDDDPVELTARLTADIEAQIRRVPEQWVWMHDRWRERPRWDVSSPELTSKC